MARALVLVALIASASWSFGGCASPCETANGLQSDPAMRTCVFSSEIEEDGPTAVTTDDGAPVAFTMPPFVPGTAPTDLPDGTALVESYYGLSWTGTGGDGSAADSASGVESMAVAPKRDRYALGMRTGGRVLVQTAGGDGLAEAQVDEGADALVGFPNRAVHLAFSPDGSLLFGGDALHNVVAWDAVTGERGWSAYVGEGLPTGDGVQALAVSSDGASVAAATRHVVYVWDAATGAPAATWRHTDKTQVTAVAFTPDGAHVAVRKQGRIYETRRRRPEDGDRPYVLRPTRTVKHAPTVFVWRLPRVSG